VAWIIPAAGRFRKMGFLFRMIVIGAQWRDPLARYNAGLL
jgi:hypothetical protein